MRRFRPVDAAKGFKSGRERNITGQRPANLGRGVNVDSSAFTHQEQPESVVQVSIRQKHCFDLGAAQGFRSRTQMRNAFELHPQIRRGIQQEPGLAIGTDGC